MRAGQPSSVTFSPGLMLSLVQPRRVRIEGEFVSALQLSVAPFYQNNHTWVPIEFFEAFETPAFYDASTNTVTMNA